MARIRHPANRTSPSRSTLAFFPFPSAATTRDSGGLRRQRPPQRRRPRPVAHPEAQRRVSAQRPRVVVVPAALGREKERGAQKLRHRVPDPAAVPGIADPLAIQRTTPLRRSTSRPVTAPASPVIRSPRTSILSDLLKPSVHGIIFTFA